MLAAYLHADMMKHICVLGTLFASMVASAAAPEAAKTAIRDIHSRKLTPASDALFAAESTAPANDKDWTRLGVSAATLVEAAGQLAAVPATKTEKKWQSLAARLRKAAEDAGRAAAARNQDALVSANGNVIATCEACHDDYRDAGHGMTSDKTPERQK
jgi:hypothetical protein